MPARGGRGDSLSPSIKGGELRPERRMGHRQLFGGIRGLEAPEGLRDACQEVAMAMIIGLEATRGDA